MERELAATSQEFEYLYRKFRRKMLIGGESLLAVCSPLRELARRLVSLTGVYLLEDWVLSDLVLAVEYVPRNISRRAMRDFSVTNII